MSITRKRATELREQFVVDGQGTRKAVILPIEEYERLLEDLHDLVVVSKRRDEESMSLDEVRKRLQADGLL